MWTQALNTDEAGLAGPQVMRLIGRAIARRDLDLTGLSVLTEAGVGLACLTPVMAAAAGAEVYAVCHDTVDGTRHDAERLTSQLAAGAMVQDRVHLLATRLHAPRAGVDIITNLPGVQPIDESVLRTAGETAAVTLMRGVAGVRGGEVDLAACRRLRIAVAGVSEEALGLSRSVASSALWGLLWLGIDITGAVVIVAGEGPECASAARGLARAGVRVLAAIPENAGRLDLYDAEKIGDFLCDESALSRLPEADAVIVCAGHPDTRTVGVGAWLDAAELAGRAPHIAVVHLGGELDRRALAAEGLRFWPPSVAGVAAELLPGPRLERHAAGLKVGEVLTRARRRGSSPPAAEQLAATEAGAELVPQDLSDLRR